MACDNLAWLAKKWYNTPLDTMVTVFIGHPVWAWNDYFNPMGLIVPVTIFFFAQRAFMQGVV